MTTATGFSAILGQQPPIRLLKTFIRDGTVPHALLFSGDDGVGKKMTATAFAMALNCLTLQSATRHRLPLEAIDACHNCIPCRKIAGNHHPDIIHVAPLSSVIKIAQIRTLLQTLALKSNEAKRRVVILSDAQSMNPEAANALLKVLEEPPERTCLLLMARQTSDLLPTVVSRCHHIRFLPLGAAEIEHLLTKAGDIESSTATTVAGLCGGSYSRAQKLIDGQWLRRRDWIIEAMGGPMTTDSAPGIRAWLAFSEMLAKKKDHIEESLEIITMWLRDLVVVSCDPKRVLNKDRLDILMAASQQVSPTRRLEQIDAVNSAVKALRSNTNTRLTLDAMVLRMAGLKAQSMGSKGHYEQKGGRPVQSRRQDI